MKNEFLSYKLALRLKQLGFDEPCLACYIDEEDKDILSFSFDSFYCYQEIEDNELKRNTQFNNSITSPTYQQAFKWLYQKLDIEKGVMPLDIESQQLLLKELIDKVSSKHLLV